MRWGLCSSHGSYPDAGCHGCPPSPCAVYARPELVRRLPSDLEAMLLAGHLVETEPGVFRRARHTPPIPAPDSKENQA